MTTPASDFDLDKLARKRVKAKLGFYMHLAIYIIVNTGLIATSLWHGQRWAFFPLFGWGIGLFFHGASVWLTGSGSALREDMVARERAKISKERGL